MKIVLDCDKCQSLEDCVAPRKLGDFETLQKLAHCVVFVVAVDRAPRELVVRGEYRIVEGYDKRRFADHVEHPKPVDCVHGLQEEAGRCRIAEDFS